MQALPIVAAAADDAAAGGINSSFERVAFAKLSACVAGEGLAFPSFFEAFCGSD